MAGVRKLPSGKYQAWFTDWTGKRQFFVHNTNPKETKRIAESLEDRNRRIRVGDLPVPKSSDMPHLFREVVKEYLDWGRAQGGHGGRPWSPVHSTVRARHLEKFWPKQLNPQTVQEVTLPRVEAAARDLAKTKTGKTVQSHIESMKALLLWCKQRGYVEKNALEGIAPFDTTPKNRRAALTEEQLAQLLAVAPPDRRIVYEVATCTGYRKGELAALKVGDLDVKNLTLPLAAEFSKGRRDSRQPVPAVLVEKLRQASAGKSINEPLLTINFHMDRLFHRDREAAEIPEKVPGGKLVFHSLRHTYCTFVIDTGANLTEAQRLMRHQDPKLTANIYAHARQDRLHSVAEQIGKRVMSSDDRAPSVHGVAAGAESLDLDSLCENSSKGSNPFTRSII